MTILETVIWRGGRDKGWLRMIGTIINLHDFEFKNMNSPLSCTRSNTPSIQTINAVSKIKLIFIALNIAIACYHIIVFETYRFCLCINSRNIALTATIDKSYFHLFVHKWVAVHLAASNWEHSLPQLCQWWIQERGATGAPPPPNPWSTVYFKSHFVSWDSIRASKTLKISEPLGSPWTTAIRDLPLMMCAVRTIFCTPAASLSHLKILEPPLCME